MQRNQKMQLQLLRSLEQKQGTAHALCTEPRGWANHLSHPSGLTSGHTPTLGQCNEQAHCLPCLPVWGPSNQRKLVCSCSFLLSMGFPFPLPTPGLPWISCLVFSQFLLIKEAKNSCKTTMLNVKIDRNLPTTLGSLSWKLQVFP